MAKWPFVYILQRLFKCFPKMIAALYASGNFIIITRLTLPALLNKPLNDSVHFFVTWFENAGIVFFCGDW